MLQGSSINFFESNNITTEYIKEIQPQEGIFINSYSFACYVSIYLFAVNYCKNNNILDIACGLGYGSHLISQIASKVTGVDISESSLQYARSNYSKENIEFFNKNALNLDFQTSTFDCVLSIETFEHIPKDLSDQFIHQLIRVLRPGGVLVLSTPNGPIYSQISKTPDHVNEVGVQELNEILVPKFKSVEFYYQRQDVIDEMKTFYKVVGKDRFKIRNLIPAFLKSLIKKKYAKDLTLDMEGLLQKTEVKKAENLKDVEKAVTQIVVCHK